MKKMSWGLICCFALLASCWHSCADKLPSQKCTEKDIKSVINPQNHGFKKNIDRCATQAMGDARATMTCLKRSYPQLSNGCAGCFGEMAQCSAKHCAFACMFDHDGKDCRSCTTTNCQNPKNGSFSLVRCTGLTNSQLPPGE